MTNLPYAHSFKSLLVYTKAKELEREIFRLSASFPRDEVHSLTSQIRRSSRAIGANIAEAWAKRRYEKHFVSKLTDADGEQMETQHWIGTATDCRYCTEEAAAALISKCEEIGRLLGGMMAKAKLFCGDPSRTLHESSTIYFINAQETDEN